MPGWTDEDLRTLREMYGSHSNGEIGEVLGRSFRAIASKAFSLGLKKSWTRLQSMGRENVALRGRSSLQHPQEGEESP